jgi:hypothetical protein
VSLVPQLADRVVTAGMTWVAPADAADPHPAPLQQSVPVDRLFRVARAGWFVPAARRHPGKEDPVELDEPDPDPFHVAVGPPSTPPRWRSRPSAPTKASWSESTIAGRAMMRTSQPGWNEGAIALSASRIRRLTRFRTTAPPSFRPVDSPNRVVSRSVRRNRAEKSGWDRLVPEPWSAAKSCGRESITSRGGYVPRPSVRPSAASDREPAGRRSRVGRRRFASERETRAPSRDGASWAGRSASSSGLCAILSVPPRVDNPTPRGTQTRLAPVSASARSSSGG